MHDHASRCRRVATRHGGAAAAYIGAVLPGPAPTRGRLLVATPLLDDPNFDRTVIYMVEHHDEGALGLVLNRPSGEELGDPLERWVDRAVGAVAGVLRRAGRARRADRPRRLEHRVTPAPPTTSDANYLAPLTGDIASADLAADPGPRDRADQRPAGVPRLRRLGTRPARGGDRVRARGSWSTPSPPTCSPTSPTSCGGACCAANPAASAGSPKRPTTSPGTDGTRVSRVRRGGSAPSFRRRPATPGRRRRRCRRR